jgi:hypothetical protein
MNVAQALVKVGVSVNAIDNRRRNAAHVALRYRHQCTLEMIETPEDEWNASLPHIPYSGFETRDATLIRGAACSGKTIIEAAILNRRSRSHGNVLNGF